MRKPNMQRGLATELNLLAAALLSTLATSGESRATASEGNRQRGEKRDVVVYAKAEEYASFPILARTDQELALLFQVQDLTKLRASGAHPHGQSLAVPRWATSRDGGLAWNVHETCPPLGRVRDIGYGSAPLEDGGTVTLTFSSTEPLQAIVQHGTIGYRPYQDAGREPGDKYPVTDLGPFKSFYPMGMKRLSDGTLLAAGYVPFKSAAGRDKTTAAFLTSRDAGRTWTYLSHIPHANPFDFSEPDVIETRDGRLLVLLRADWDSAFTAGESLPADAGMSNGNYGYFLYQAESTDGGKTWSEATQLPLWGHPPYLLRLASGKLLMVYGHRRQPWGIRAVLSRDEGRTWDTTSLKTVYEFPHGGIDLGYPVATQLADGAIVCAFYGYPPSVTRESQAGGSWVPEYIPRPSSSACSTKSGSPATDQ